MRDIESKWPIGSDYVVAVAIEDITGTALVDGDVTAVMINNCCGAVVTGLSSLTFAFVTPNWECMLPQAGMANLVAGKEYTLQITAVDAEVAENTQVHTISRTAGYLTIEEVEPA